MVAPPRTTVPPTRTTPPASRTTPAVHRCADRWTGCHSSPKTGHRSRHYSATSDDRRAACFEHDGAGHRLDSNSPEHRAARDHDDSAAD